MAKVKYPGELGKAMPRAPANVSEDFEAKQAWISKQEVRTIFLLMDHYQIDRGIGDPLFTLAYKLAKDHVPAMRQARVGRPTTLVSLAKKYAQFQQHGKPGRKRRFSDETLRDYLNAVEDIKRERGWKGHGSNRKALRALLSDDAKRRGKSITRALADLPWWEKKLSEAQRRFSGNRKKT